MNSYFSDIKIDKAEVLNFLGYKDKNIAETQLNSVCDESIRTIEESSRPAFLCSYFDIEPKEDDILLCGTRLLLKGKSIRHHLEYCNKIALFCVTLSTEIDNVIMRAKFDVLRQLFLDMAASVYVEQICERVCQIIKNDNKNLFNTKRYGIGYGDFSLFYQQDILTILNAQKRIGVMATADGILTPRKSVTAIVGVSDIKVQNSYQPCDSCLLRSNCEYFMRGEYCGK